MPSHKASTEVISAYVVTGFTVLTDKVAEAHGVSTLLHHETKVNRDPLVASGGLHGADGTQGQLTPRGSQTDRTLFDF